MSSLSLLVAATETVPENEKLQLLLGNARQIHNIVKATFTQSPAEDGSPTNCRLATSNAEELACLWNHAEKRLKEQRDSADDGSGKLFASLTEVKFLRWLEKALYTDIL